MSFVGLSLLVLLIAYLLNTSWEKLLPWGMPIPWDDESFREYATVNYSETSLMFKHGRTKLIVDRQNDESHIRGPETIVVNPSEPNVIYMLTEEGYLVSVTDFQPDQVESNVITASTSIKKDLGNGRPLGGSFTQDGTILYIADAVLGLTRIQNLRDPHYKVEVVASSIVNNDSGKHYSKLHYVDDLCIGPKTGKVYFTDASEIRPDIIGRNIPDTLYASKMDLIRGKPTGRVLEYDPETDQVRVLAQGLMFANGIAVDQEETYLVFAETFGPRILKYYLEDTAAGNKAGEIEVVVDRSAMMGYPDGVDCNHETGKCYAVMPSSIVPVHKLLAKLPNILAWSLRLVIMMLPRQFSPPVQKFGGLLEFDPQTLEHRYLLDPTGKDIGMLCGVTAFQNKLYLGSLQNDFIGVYDLSQ